MGARISKSFYPLLCLFVAGLAAGSTRASENSPWYPLADTVLRTVAKNGDMPNAVVPVAMAQDGRGFLWLAGAGGLLRWDGYQFREYKADDSKPDGLQDADMNSLHRDTHGRLWAATVAGGLARYDGEQDRWLCIKLVDGRCGTQQVWSMDDDGDGGLWVATGVGLYRLGPDGTVHSRIVHAEDDPASLPDDQVLAVLRDRQGVLWIGTSRGLSRSVDAGQHFAAVTLPGGPQRAVSHLMEDSADRIWLGTRQEGAFVLDADRKTLQVIPETARTASGDTATEVTSLAEVAPDRVWIGTYGSGVAEVDGKTLRTRRIVRDPFVPSSLDSNSVQSLYRDDSGITWVGTEGGVSQYIPGGELITIFGSAGRRSGLPGESAASLLAQPDGSLWVGMAGEGFVALDPRGGRVGGLDGRRVFAMAPGPSGGVLLGTDGGLFLADATARRVTRLSVPQQSPAMDVRVLYSSDGFLWLGGRDDGLLKLRIHSDGKIDLVAHEMAPHLTHSVVRIVTKAPDGRLVIGTDGGVTLLDPVTDKAERIVPDPSSPDGLMSGRVGGIASDRSGRLWVGTDAGIAILDRRDASGRPHFLHLGVANGLPNASVDSLKVDRQGRVWAATDMGLATIDPDSLAVHALGHADGLAITNYFNTSTETTDGDIVFGGIGGITIVHPGAGETWHYRPPVVITGARIGGKSVPIPRRSGDTLIIPPDANSLAVEFAALDYSDPERNRYSYRLEGFDADWVQADASHRVAAYTNLPPGHYVLRLRGSNRNGLWSDPETLLGVQVMPAWNQTIWFGLAEIIGGIVLAVALLRAWTTILRKQQKELERQVADRTTDLTRSQQQLQIANEELEARVTERTHALEEQTTALAASEARFRAWFDNAEDAVFVMQVKPGRRFVFEAANQAIERISGIPARAFLDRQPEEVLPAEAAAILTERCIEATEGEPIQFEAGVKLPTGDRLLDTWIVPLRNPVTGRVERLVGALRDMTERRALEARLAQAQKLQALGELAGGIAHDFNNILQAVSGAAMLIEQRPDDHDKIRRLARAAMATAERGASITKRLLAFARSDELRVEALDSLVVLDGVREVLAHALGSNIVVRADFTPNLPSLLSDRGQLETALVNLGTNARDAMPSGGILTLSAAPEIVTGEPPHRAGLTPGRYVRISVADTGCGMDATTLGRAVEPFFTTKPLGKGTGLGLAVVKGFAEQSGGGLAISSALGAGTTITLWLRQAEPGLVPVQPPPKPPTSRRPLSVRVLVVDDDDMVREMVSAGLEEAGFTVEVAASGAEAVALIDSVGAPDAVVCDFAMPGMNGVETIKRVRERRPGVPCFLLTGYAGDRVALESADAFTLIRKPISGSVLIAHIEAALASTRR